MNSLRISAKPSSIFFSKAATLCSSESPFMSRSKHPERPTSSFVTQLVQSGAEEFESGRQLFGIGLPARRKNQVIRATAASITEDIITASTTVTELRTGAASRMLLSHPGREATRRLLPVIRT